MNLRPVINLQQGRLTQDDGGHKAINTPLMHSRTAPFSLDFFWLRTRPYCADIFKVALGIYDLAIREATVKTSKARLTFPRKKAIVYRPSWGTTMETATDQIPDLAIYGFLAVIAVGVTLGFGENRKIVVYQNYDDLGLTFMVPILAYVSLLLSGMKEEALINLLLAITAAALSFGIFGYTVHRTFTANGHSLWRTAVSLVTKFPLAFIWVLQIVNIISPSGKTALERSQNRANALLILTILTPIITALVVERTGFFSPRKVLKGRRIGSIRDTL